MTDKVSFIEVIAGEETQTHAIIEREDGSTVAMLKSTYEAQQVEHLTEIPTK
jgi:hypothetical protein